jgi:hypothetical protein
VRCSRERIAADGAERLGICYDDLERTERWEAVTAIPA